MTRTKEAANEFDEDKITKQERLPAVQDASLGGQMMGNKVVNVWKLPQKARPRRMPSDGEEGGDTETDLDTIASLEKLSIADAPFPEESTEWMSTPGRFEFAPTSPAATPPRPPPDFTEEEETGSFFWDHLLSERVCEWLGTWTTHKRGTQLAYIKLRSEDDTIDSLLFNEEDHEMTRLIRMTIHYREKTQLMPNEGPQGPAEQRDWLIFEGRLKQGWNRNEEQEDSLSEYSRSPGSGSLDDFDYAYRPPPGTRHASRPRNRRAVIDLDALSSDDCDTCSLRKPVPHRRRPLKEIPDHELFGGPLEALHAHEQQDSGSDSDDWRMPRRKRHYEVRGGLFEIPYLDKEEAEVDSDGWVIPKRQRESRDVPDHAPSNDYWILAIPTCGITDEKRVQVQFDDGRRNEFEWTVGQEGFVPSMHGKGVDREFFREFIEACVQGKGVVESAEKATPFDSEGEELSGSSGVASSPPFPSP